MLLCVCGFGVCGLFLDGFLVGMFWGMFLVFCSV